jgi:phosphoribosylformylglycinamidine synthase subunit PurQ / glutaminase
MAKKIKILIPIGFGLNCDYETQYAYHLATKSNGDKGLIRWETKKKVNFTRRENSNAIIDNIHLSELYADKIPLQDYHHISLIGGFEHGDDNGSAVAWADNMKQYLGDKLYRFIEDKKPILGICNGFQALGKLGLLPGLDDYQTRRITVTYNDCGNFRDQWVTIHINLDSPCIYTKGISLLKSPVRHGEGKIIIDSTDTLDRIIKNEQHALMYNLKDTKKPAQGNFPDNPNGSEHDIAGICDPTGLIFGLMPHPEAFNDWTNADQWTRTKYEMKKKGINYKEINPEGDGIKIFRNVCDYIKENLL